MNADRIIATLGLAPHPEGGHFKEVFRSRLEVTRRDGSTRSASTAIYFLLRAEEFSAFHRVSSDEAWHHYGGDPLELHVLDGDGHRTIRLGADVGHDERPFAVVPANAWQAARPVAGTHGYSLSGCTVAPGFDFADFEMPARAALLALFPELAPLIVAFTR